MIWHSSDISEVKRELEVDETVGLLSSEIAGRIQKYGENKQTVEKENNVVRRILKHLTPMADIFLMIVAAVYMVIGIIGKSGDWYISIPVFILLALNAVGDVLVGLKAEGEISELKGNVALSAKVKRDGEVQVIDSALLVPGDIVLLEAGDYIPADGRLLEGYSLTCDESAVSGDSAPSEKQAEYLPENICPLEERKNMVYAGCSVIYGHGTMLVTETGMNTELARQAAILELTVGTDIPVKRRLTEIGRISKIAVLAVCAIVFLLGVISGIYTDNFGQMVIGMLFISAALCVAAIPEDAAQAVTIALGFGAHRMKKRKAVIQNISAVENLGCTSVIISDKTGTLTKNRMKMTMVYDGNELIDLNLEDPGENAVTLIRTGALCCNGSLETVSGGRQKAVGDPTEVGIVAACMEYCGLSKSDIENIYPRMDEVPFDSARKLMTTINMINNRPFAIVKGSPDILMECCTGGNVKGAAEAAEEMSKRGLRAIAVAIKPLSEVPSNPNPDNMECELSLLGLFGMTDTISRETTAALRESESAGITTVMITGDHIIAAESIAKSLGILKQGQRAVTGEELGQMTDEELQSEVRNIAVYSRISHEDKLRVVAAWQALGETVAITGDSVEDSAVLKNADVGCAMGVTGTDIAKGSADVILTEDSYISIVGAVKESRGIYANIKRIASLVLSSALGELLLMVLSLLFFGAPALSVMSLLWMNLVVGFCLIIALSAENAGKGIMTEPPRNQRDSFFKGDYGLSIIWQGVMLGVIGLVAYIIGGSAMAFATVVLAQNFLAFGLRSELSVFKEGIHTNKYMLGALGVSVLSLIIIFATPLSTLFSLGNIGNKIIYAVLLSLIPLAVTECVKLAKKFFKK